MKYFYSTIPRSLFILLVILSTTKLPAQNLLDNNGFEDLNVCTEYHATCAPESWFYILPATNPLVNRRVAPKPILGTQLLLLPMYDLSRQIKPLVYTMLICPLQKSKQYKLSFYVNTSGRKFYNIDIAFLKKEPTYRDVNPYAVIPNIKITQSDMVAEIKGWQAVEYIFTATDDASFMLIGNINSTNQMKYAAVDGMNKPGMVYYFIDEIVLRPLIPEPLCKNASSNLEKMHRQDLRHTEYVLVDDAPAVDTPQIIIDTLILPSVLFKTNSAIIEKKFASILDSMIAELLKKNIQTMQIIGHTDNRGKYENNLVLSQNRAISVQQYIQSKLSVKNITTDGKADTVPIADNATESDRMKNRRVEIIISYLQKEE